MKNEVVVIGTFCVDVITKGFEEKIIRPDNISFSDKTILALGGNGNNVAIDLSNLGVKVKIMGELPKNFIGECVEKLYKEKGIETEYINDKDEGDIGVSTIFVDGDGEKSILQFIGTNNEFELSKTQLDEAKENGYVVITGLGLVPNIEVKFREITKELHDNGCTIFVDTSANVESLKKYMYEDFFRYVDYFIPNSREAMSLSGMKSIEEAALYFRSIGCRNVIVKMGEQGCLLANENMIKQIPAKKVDAIDTTGAGDAFVAGLVCSLLKGCSLIESIFIANDVGADCVQKIGAYYNIKKWEYYKKN